MLPDNLLLTSAMMSCSSTTQACLLDSTITIITLGVVYSTPMSSKVPYIFDYAYTSWIRNTHAYNLENSQCGHGRDQLGYWTPNLKALFTRFIHRVLLQYLTMVSLFHSTAHSRREMKRDPIKRSKLPSNVTSLVAFWKHLSLPIDRSCIPRRHAVFALSYS